MNNKGQAWIVVIVAVLIVVVGIVVLIAILNQDKETPKIYADSPMIVYLIARDSSFKSSIPGSYVLSNYSGFVTGDILKDAFTEINNVSRNQTIRVLCRSPGYYSTYISKDFSSQELLQNISKIDCPLDQVGKLAVESKDELKDGERTITLNVLSKGIYKDLTVCTSWTSSVIKVELKDGREDDIPARYKNLVDNCFGIDKNLENEATDLVFNVKAENLTRLDSVSFYIFDKDMAFDETTNSFTKLSEYNKTNLGSSEDIKYVITYIDS